MRAYLPAYDVLCATSLEDGLRQLAATPTLRVLAGGTDVMVLLEAGDLPPGKFLSIWGLPELRGIRVADDAVTLGALTTYAEIAEHAVLEREFPLLCRAARANGAVAIQNRGTLGGNIMNASPAADSPPALAVYGAELELAAAARGARRVAYDGFHTGYKRMDRRPDELLTAIRLPRRPGTGGGAGGGELHYYRKVGTREAQAISKVVIAAYGRRDPATGAIAECRIAFGSVAPTVLRARATERAILGRMPDAAAAVAARAAASAEVTPIDDIRSTARYRRAVAGNLAAEFVARLAAERGGR
ncbi:MAG: FAD binding domain-containing protein [Planctomycetes bacterium]|nr:FAD binding domain-containing protein [Planctomycetota bacterium]